MSSDQSKHQDTLRGQSSLFEQQLSSANAVLALSLVLMQAGSSRQVARLTATAIPSIAPTSVAQFWHHNSEGVFYDLAPSQFRQQLAKLSRSGGQIHLDAGAWAWAYPLGIPGLEQLFLVVVAPRVLRDEDQFLISVLAQISGTVISKLESIDGERAAADQLSVLNAELASNIEDLRKLMEAHRQLNSVVAHNRGEQGIAETLSRLTGRAVVIEDIHGNVQAASGDINSEIVKDTSDARQDLIRRLSREFEPIHRRGSWLALANPRTDIAGLIRLLDSDKKAMNSDLAALQYAATVLGMELARIQSVAEAELRSHRDFAEELLAGSEPATAKATGRALRYDVERPHRVVIASTGPHDRLPAGFYDAVAGQVRRLDLATLVVGRSDGVIVIATRDTDWRKLRSSICQALHGGTCRLAIGSVYPSAWDASMSYREAQFAANLAPTLPANAAEVLEFEALGVYRLLSSVTDVHGVSRYVEAQVGSLIAYDRDHGTALMRTLSCFLDHGCNYEDTASELFVHKGTVKYRIKRITELTGRDLTDGTTRLDLHLAARIWTTTDSLGLERSTGGQVRQIGT